MIELALRKTRGDQTAAADVLGVYRSRLVRRLKALGLGNGNDTGPNPPPTPSDGPAK
jgi:DNA-binding NtrC family response regulator